MREGPEQRLELRRLDRYPLHLNSASEHYHLQHFYPKFII